MKRHGLTRNEAGNWLTPSGRYSVEFDVSYENECECIHCLDSRTEDCRSAVPGQAAQKGWHVWDEHTGDYAERSGYQTFDTMKDAAAHAMACEEAEVEEGCDHTDHIVGPDGRCPECGAAMEGGA